MLLGDSGGSCGQQLPQPHPRSQIGAQLGEGKGWALLRRLRVLEEAPGPSYPCAHSWLPREKTKVRCSLVAALTVTGKWWWNVLEGFISNREATGRDIETRKGG